MNCEKVASHIIDWLNNYIKDVPVKGFIVGVSGGVDSALVSTLCAHTKRKVILLNMPIRQSESEYLRSQNQIDALVSRFPNVEGQLVDLTATFESFEQTMGDKVKSDLLAMANSRARIRMTTLYAIGQANNLLIAGTGNKVEDFGIGFFTKYGDGGVDLSPIGDLVKSEVFQLAKYLNVNQDILDAKPTDGLWGDERNDEDQIGATYDELEFAMAFDGDINSLSDRKKEVLAIYKRLNSINQHKMVPIPVCQLDGVK
ncbi:NAD(+) synthase [Brumimicrobium aurantiacum]|uniref:NH(3)-dependent NAD(+) synthetase n=1 Tax=Brumimicrobium aurantiacum TaxID=1737063 RepID=A0A3E1EV67_9FLAO|nr:NAD(+) synthase [Brumimicrobium aurantiacum]RFC53430.1 NAD(+) synthase [Brumimicrobium aurantiacum]